MLVSLFDESGNAVRNAAIEGEECHCFDLEAVERVEHVGLGSIHYHRADLRDPAVIDFIISLRPDRIIGFPPCTDLAACGAKHFAAKREKDPDFQVRAVELAFVIPLLGDILNVPWMFENPRGSMSTLWRRPDFVFNPNEYGGWLPEDDTHPRFPEIIEPRDAYPKETWIWHGNGHVEPERRPVPPIDDFHGWKRLGGSSKRTKQIRSETPRGFAKAEHEANRQASPRGETAIQTFLPYPNFAASAMVLDRKRLNQQVNEARQILSAIRNGGGWRNHPAVKMWHGHSRSLMLYHDVMLREWVRRGYQTTREEIVPLPPDTDLRMIWAEQFVMPPWLGRGDFHASHRSMLLAKDPAHYAWFGWEEEPGGPYIWPTP